MNVAIIIDNSGKLEFDLTHDQVTKMLSCAFGNDPRLNGILPAVKETEKPVQPPRIAERAFSASNTSESRVSRMFGNDWRNNVSRTSEPRNDIDGVKGFLLLECPTCRTRKAFCTKSPIKTSYCSCGETIKIDDLIPVEIKCKCGRTWRYKTNIKDRYITHNCLDCGSPVDLEYNSRRNRYETIGGGR
ncbi:MAG: hypothetical protein IKP95_09280 [Ruminococcus sp.]|nr:hypothetical protein [Ruminococcus sp.]